MGMEPVLARFALAASVVVSATCLATGSGLAGLEAATAAPVNQGWDVADFDGDGRGDVFVLNPESGAWFVNYGGQSEWADVNTSQLDWERTWLADMDGDGKSDVFSQLPDGRWMVSHSAVTSWTQLNMSEALDPARTHVEDINGDGRADVLTLRAGGVWHVSYAGIGGWTQINMGDIDPSRTWVADMNGDLKADVFTQLPDGRWAVSYSASTAWNIINGSEHLDPTRTFLGDVDGDGKADVFAVDAASRWLVSYGGTSAWTVVNNGSLNPSQSRAVDMNADGHVDLFTIDHNFNWLVSFGMTSSWSMINTGDLPNKATPTEVIDPRINPIVWWAVRIIVKKAGQELIQHYAVEAVGQEDAKEQAERKAAAEGYAVVEFDRPPVRGDFRTAGGNYVIEWYKEPVKAEGYRSFSALKRAYGTAGAERAWHHIVEQSSVGAQNGTYRNWEIHNKQNLINIRTGVHETCVNSLMSRMLKNIPLERLEDISITRTASTRDLTLREVIGYYSFRNAHTTGLKVLRVCGVRIRLP
jgi:hypothetical protein